MKKNLIISIVCAFVVIVLIVVIINKKSNAKPQSNQEQLQTNLEKLGREFYEKFYYPRQVEVSEKTSKSNENKQTFEELMKKFEGSGITVNLDNISKPAVVDSSLAESMVNSITKEKCNGTNTTVTIVPHEPYGVTDYTITVDLQCGSFNIDK